MLGQVGDGVAVAQAWIGLYTVLPTMEKTGMMFVSLCKPDPM